jgi:WD40 repeat protein
MRVRRWWPIAAPLLVLAAAGYVAALIYTGSAGAAPWWLAGSAAAALVVAGTAGLLQRHTDRRLLGLVPPAERPESWAVRRPREVGAVVTVLCRGAGPMVGITTALPGAGGFGKTTVAKLARTDRRVLRRFGDRVHWVTFSRDVRAATAIAEKLNELNRQLGSDRTFTDPREAGEHLGALLDQQSRRLLVVVDDVWFPEQLAPFKVRGGRCACLVTTRIPELLGRGSVPVEVDRMSARQARKVLTDEFTSAVPGELIAALATATGRWPLLLRLVNRVLVNVAATNLDLTSTVRELRDRLHRQGAIGGEVTGELDVADRARRRLAVRATIEAGTRLLTGTERLRFGELGIFAADELIPMPLITQLWRATAGRDERYTGQLCARLAGLGLLTVSGDAAGLHDVIRGHLRDELGPAGIAVAHARMLESADAAWWEMNADNRYLWDHLITNLINADRLDDAERVVCDLRWVIARLIRSGPAAPQADLALVGTPRTARLRRVLDHAAPLLAATEPAAALVNVLYSRVGHEADWAPQVAALASGAPRPRLFNAWPLPDIPDPALRRTVSVEPEQITSVAIARDGAWLAGAGPGETVQIWDPETGRQIATYPGHTGGARTVAVSPEGDWLAAARDFGTVWIWDTTTGRRRFALAGHTDSVLTVAIAGKGGWLASAGRDETIRIWDAAGGRCRAVLTGHTGEVTSVAIAPDESWLASAGADRTIRIWDAATGDCRAVLEGHTGPVTAVAVAPGGTWLASAGDDCTAWIWDVATAEPRAVLEGHTRALTAVAIAPDGEWLASTARDGTARIWDPVRGHCRAVLTGHTDAVMSVAVAPGGGWLATGGNDRTVRTWDAVTGAPQGRTGRADEVTSVAAAPDGSWVAAAGDRAWAALHDATGLGRRSFQLHTRWVTGLAVAPDGDRVAVAGGFGTTGIYSTSTGRIELAPLAGHVDSVLAVAIAPDGGLLATGGRDRTARIWSMDSGAELHSFTGHTDPVVSVAFNPQSTWLATASWDSTVRIWDLGTAECRTLAGHLAPVTAMALAPDGTWLATVATDETMRIWHVRTGASVEVYTGHAGGASTVAISPDGGWLATGGADGTIRIWNPSVAHARTVMRLRGAVHACTWMPDGKALAVGASTGLYLYGFEAGLT